MIPKNATDFVKRDSVPTGLGKLKTNVSRIPYARAKVTQTDIPV